MASQNRNNDSSEQRGLSTSRYHIRGKILALGDHFKIKDQLGNTVYIVKSRILSIGDHMTLEDSNGK